MRILLKGIERSLHRIAALLVLGPQRLDVAGVLLVHALVDRLKLVRHVSGDGLDIVFEIDVVVAQDFAPDDFQELAGIDGLKSVQLGRVIFTETLFEPRLALVAILERNARQAIIFFLLLACEYD